MGSQFDDIVSRFVAPQLMHQFGNRDEDNALIVMDVYLSGQEEARSVEAFIQQDDLIDDTIAVGDFETRVKVERKRILMRRVDTSGVDLALDLDMLVVVPDGTTIAQGRWGVEQVDNADGTLASVVLVRRRPKSYHAVGYER